MLPLSVHAAILNLQWDLPTTNVNGSACTNIAHVRLYYGQESRNYTNFVEMVGPVTNGSITGLVERQTYFVAGTVGNTWGNESDFSEELETTAPDYTRPSTVQIRIKSESPRQIVIAWDAATDDAGIAGYDVSVNNVVVRVTDLEFTQMISANMIYSIKVAAIDNSGLLGEWSETLIYCQTSPGKPFNLRIVNFE